MNNNIFKALVSGLTLAVMICPQAWAVVNQRTSCGGKCTYYYNTETGDLRFEKNSDVPDDEEVIIPANLYRGNIAGMKQGNAIGNLTIGEGITGMGTWAFATYGGYQTGTSNSTLKLPSTFKSSHNLGTSDTPFWNISFGTVDASALKDTGISLNTGAIKNLILDADSNIKVGIIGATNYNLYPKEVNIICKGKKDNCLSQIKSKPTTTAISASYYTGLDEKGNWIEWSDDGLAVWSDSSKAKLLGEYDFDGNQTGMYKYDGAGNLTAAYKNGVAIYSKTLYTPAEAAAAVKEGNSNTVTITFK